MAVNSGVEHADAARAEKAVLKELADLCDGPITDEELEDCRRGLLSGMNGVEDSLGGMETWYYIEVLRAGANSAAPIQTPAQARAALQAVTKEDVRSILREALLQRATQIALIHNHPSGNPHPSNDDQRLTELVRKAAQTMNIHLTDHVIVTDGSHYSFNDEGLL